MEVYVALASRLRWLKEIVIDAAGLLLSRLFIHYYVDNGHHAYPRYLMKRVSHHVHDLNLNTSLSIAQSDLWRDGARARAAKGGLAAGGPADQSTGCLALIQPQPPEREERAQRCLALLYLA